MGRTHVHVEIAKFGDIVLRKAAGNGHKRVRKVTTRALADTASALLCLHRDTIRSLGLIHFQTARVRTSDGEVDRPIYGTARTTILGRQCSADAMEIPDNVSPRVGYIPLEALDLVVDPRTPGSARSSPAPRAAASTPSASSSLPVASQSAGLHDPPRLCPRLRELPSRAKV